MTGEKKYVELGAVIALIEKVADGYLYVETPKDNLIADVNAIPAADVEEVKHGHWVQTDDEWMCTSCWEEVTICTCAKDKTWKYRRCPNCGARMDKEDT